MSGAGYVVLDWALCIGALLACVGQAAVLRSPDVPESRLLEGARRFRVVAWGLFFGRMLYVLTHQGDLALPIYSLLPLLLLAWADAVSALARLFDGSGRHPFLRSGPTPLDEVSR